MLTPGNFLYYLCNFPVNVKTILKCKVRLNKTDTVWSVTNTNWLKRKKTPLTSVTCSEVLNYHLAQVTSLKRLQMIKMTLAISSSSTIPCGLSQGERPEKLWEERGVALRQASLANRALCHKPQSRRWTDACLFPTWWLLERVSPPSTGEQELKE